MDRVGNAIVGGFFYDADLAKFGNAISPFVQMPYERAVRAMQLPFEDRYGPRLDAPGWSDYMGAAGSGEAVGLDGDGDGEVAVSGFFDTVEERSGIKRGAVVASLGIAAVAALLAAREPRRAGEIAMFGAGGIALSLYVGSKR